MLLLTIETTCDETAAAVVTDQLEVLSSVVASQDALHERFGGVVPEIASRAHVERILPVIDEALRKANVTLADLDAVAVANTPGLAGSLLVGLTAAKTICRCVRLAAGGGQSFAGPHLRLPAGQRPRCVSVRRTGRQRRPFEPLSLRRPDRFHAAGRHDRRCGRRGVRQSRQPARAAVSGRAVDRTSGPRRRSAPTPLSAAAAGRPRAARLQLQRAEDGGPLFGRWTRQAR